MRVLKSLGGPGRSVEFGEMYQKERGDLFVVYYPYGLRYDFDTYRISSTDYSLGILVQEVKEIIEENNSKNVFIYGDFDDNDINYIKIWSNQFENVSFIVTKKLPYDVDHDRCGPFIVEEV